jgi:hypothetical protein
MNYHFMKKLLVHPVLIFGCLLGLASGGWAQLPEGLTNGLQAYWTFDGTAQDQSGNGYDLSAPNGATYTTGRNDKLTATFNGTNSFFWLPQALTTDNSFTWSLWFRTENPTRPDALINQGGPLSGSPQVSPGISLNDPNSPSNLPSSVHAGSYGDFVGGQFLNSSPLTINTASWYSVVWTSDINGDRTLYIDGILSASGTGQEFGQMNNNFYIGGVPQIDAYQPTYYFEGQLSDIAVWDRPLSATEVTDLYNAQAVPEPSTYALLLLSGASSLWALRRRKS